LHHIVDDEDQLLLVANLNLSLVEQDSQAAMMENSKSRQTDLMFRSLSISCCCSPIALRSVERCDSNSRA
jgi:hypothetical protein